MATNDKLAQWWDGLTDAQRADAAAYTRSGQMSDELRKSLQGAGFLQPGQQQRGPRVDSKVDDFLKMRHDTI